MAMNPPDRPRRDKWDRIQLVATISTPVLLAVFTVFTSIFSTAESAHQQNLASLNTLEAQKFSAQKTFDAGQAQARLTYQAQVDIKLLALADELLKSKNKDSVQWAKKVIARFASTPIGEQK